MPLKVLVQKINPSARIPAYAHSGDAGVDLYAAETVIIPAGGRALVPTGIKIAIPNGYEGQVRPKSGLALKHGITVLNTPGTVDAPYRGEVGVILFNTDMNKDYEAKAGEKIAQMVFCKVEQAELVAAETLPHTSRGEGGFGSTGLK